MNFPIQSQKATQAVARLIERSGAPIEYLRIVKLIYLADRISIITRGVPIVGGHYFSMKKGPTVSELMDFVQQRNAPQWKETISPRYGHEVRLQAVPDFGALSQAELEILDLVVASHSQRTTEELVEWCHENCPEYEPVKAGSCKPIEVESILRAANKSEERIARIVEDAQEIEELDKLLA